MGVKNLVCLVAVGLSEVFVVELHNSGILLGLADIALSIVTVKNGCTESTKIYGVTNGCGLVRLTATVYATAGTTHDLDELYVHLACLNVLKESLSCLSARSNCNVNGNVTDLVGCNAVLVIVTLTADLGSLKGLLKGLAHKNLCGVTESCLHNAARCAEDSTCAGANVERLIECLVVKLAELDASFLDHSANLAGGNGYVYVSITRSGLTVASYLELLSSTRNSGYEEDVLRIDAFLLCKVGLHKSTEHLLRRLASRKIFSEIREIMLAVLDPSGRAGGDHRKLATVLESSEKLVSLLDDGKVCGKVHIEHAVKAESLECGNHLTLNVSTGLVAEALADLCAYGGSGTDIYLLGRISDSCLYLIGIVALVDSANGASYDTLTAVYAGYFAKVCVKCATDVGIKSALVCTDNADALHYLTSGNATTAKDALVVIADDGGRGIYLVVILFALECVLVYSVLVAELLKLAGGGAYARETSLVVVGENELKVGLSCSVDLGSIGEDGHTLGYGVNASGYHAIGSAALGYFNKAETASADLVDILKIAKSGNIDFCDTGSLKDGHTLIYGVISAIDLDINFFHCGFLLIL